MRILPRFPSKKSILPKDFMRYNLKRFLISFLFRRF